MWQNIETPIIRGWGDDFIRLLLQIPITKCRGVQKNSKRGGGTEGEMANIDKSEIFMWPSKKKKKLSFFLDRFLVESVFSFFFFSFFVFFNKVSPQNNLEARDRYCVERDVQRHKNYWARELVKRMIIPIFPQGSERVKKPEMWQVRGLRANWRLHSAKGLLLTHSLARI